MYRIKFINMKKLITSFIFLIATFLTGYSQYFQGTFSNVGNKVTVKVRPTGTINSGINKIEFSFRYNIASTPAFTITNVVANTVNFPGLVFNFGDGYHDATYNYKTFLSTSSIAQKVYSSGVEYELVSFNLEGLAPATANIELAHNLETENYLFTFNDGASNLFDPGEGAVFYGAGYTNVGSDHFLPLVGVPLPVKFLGFDATKKNNSAILNWSVENESALTDKYVIESGFNGIDFPNTIATVAAYNNGKAANTYSFTQDNLSAVRNSGVLYYRIKQIDKDGKFVYTPIKNVRLDGKAFAVNAYPNPVKGFTKLTIDLLEEAKVIISITDASGKQVKGMQVQGFKGPNIKEVNLSNLTSGNYMLKVQSGTEIKSLPLVKVD
jgi:hypothetical protein